MQPNAVQFAYTVVFTGSAAFTLLAYNPCPAYPSTGIFELSRLGNDSIEYFLPLRTAQIELRQMTDGEKIFAV